jgi:hypothetical protein
LYPAEVFGSLGISVTRSQIGGSTTEIPEDPGFLEIRRMIDLQVNNVYACPGLIFRPHQAHSHADSKEIARSPPSIIETEDGSNNRENSEARLGKSLIGSPVCFCRFGIMR